MANRKEELGGDDGAEAEMNESVIEIKKKVTTKKSIFNDPDHHHPQDF
jgi:hypothetical protein